ncbi:hypothetical protein C8Q76DRAFT_810334 [Earliella scabrosa]|nr:hypothetical protein C8Q76DRAFT_810334 [Earliella scabrosa]
MDVKLKIPPVILPIELVIDILREAQYDDLLPHYKWLRNYSLVCRAWRIHAQPLLFTYVALTKGAKQCKTFKDSMASAADCDPEHAARLREAVRTLVLTMDHQEIYAEVLNLCPNLRELQVTLYHACFRPEVLKQLRRAPRVQALRVRSNHCTPLFQLLGAFSSVEYLEVDCNSIRDVPDFPLSPPSWRLRELRYHNLRNGTHNFIEWALSGAARETLEIIHSHCPSFDLSMLVRLGITTTLRSISVNHVRETDDLAVFSNLQELAINFPFNASLTFNSLPPSVVHITSDTMSPASCAAMLEGLTAYQERSNGALRVLTYNRRPGIPGLSQDTRMLDAEKLYEFCARSGVEFRLMDPPYGFYAGEHAPLGSTESFPRPAPVSSRRPRLSETTLPWQNRRDPSLARRIASAAGRAFSGSIPPMALARP